MNKRKLDPNEDDLKKNRMIKKILKEMKATT